MHNLSSETMKKDWIYFLCRSDEVAEGGYRAINSFGKSMIATKQESLISVDNNVCPHRGHRFTLSDSGMLPLACPYHGRPFEPKSEQFFFFNMANYLFVSLDEKKDFFPFFHNEHAELLKRSVTNTKLFATVEQTVAAPFWLWMQNAMDVDHLKTVHSDFYRFFNLEKPITRNFSPNFHGSSHRIFLTDETIKTYSQLYNGARFPQYFEQMTIFPNVSVTTFLGVFYSVETVYPYGGACRVKTDFYFNSSLKISDGLLKQTQEANKTLLAEDKAICESWASNYEGLESSQWTMPDEIRLKVFLAILDGKTINEKGEVDA